MLTNLSWPPPPLASHAAIHAGALRQAELLHGATCEIAGRSPEVRLRGGGPYVPVANLPA